MRARVCMTHITDHLSIQIKIFPKVKGRREKKERGGGG
jgi:hypothetical protein